MPMPKFDVYELVGHLMKCPDVFASQVGDSEDFTNALALIYDTYRIVANDFFITEFELPNPKECGHLELNHWQSILMSCWLLRHPDFNNLPKIASQLSLFWFQELKIVSRVVSSDKWLKDEERAEEMVRIALKCFELLAAGETLAETADRLTAVSSIARLKILKETNEALERMMEIKRKMAEKKAREAANAYGRE